MSGHCQGEDNAHTSRNGRRSNKHPGREHPIMPAIWSNIPYIHFTQVSSDLMEVRTASQASYLTSCRGSVQAGPAEVSHAPSYIYLLCSCTSISLQPSLICTTVKMHSHTHACTHACTDTRTHMHAHINSLHTGRYTGVNSSSVLLYTQRSFPDVLVHNPCAPSPQVLHIVHLLHTFVSFITLCVLSALCTVVYCCQSPTCIYTLVSFTILCAFCALCSIANWYVEHSAYSL